MQLSRDQDPYHDTAPQATPEAIYRLPLGPLLGLLALGLFVFAGMVTIFVDVPVLCYSIAGIVFLIFLTNTTSFVRCSETHLEVRYWLRPKTKIRWIDIESLRIVPVRGQKWCYVRVRNRLRLLPVSFVVTTYFGRRIESMSVLVKTIIVKASLEFKEVSGFGIATYQSSP